MRVKLRYAFLACGHGRDKTDAMTPNRFLDPAVVLVVQKIAAENCHTCHYKRLNRGAIAWSRVQLL
jgi:hypothetical protein